ncbi:transposase [Corynebacterium diphtheriae]|uniref:transposase n=1 Tax=Corynebacterium diphtheriae TaxID=1717 RepID=UPI001F530BC9|nr:transposase [Corynebacterium diphtheriae]
MSALIDTLVGMKDAVVAEIVQLGRTMNKRRKGILAYFDHKQCTLKPEEPPLSGGGAPTSAHQRPPAPTSASQSQPSYGCENVLLRVVPRRQHPTHNQCTLKPEEPVNPSPRDDRCRIVINCWNDHCPLSVEPCVTSNTM